MQPHAKVQASDPFLTNIPKDRVFMEQYWVAQYFGNDLLRNLLRICPWYYRQTTESLRREWRRRELNRIQYRSVEWLVRRYGIFYQSSLVQQQLSVTHSEWQHYEYLIPPEVQARLFSPSLRRHILDVQWTSTMDRKPSFMESNCRFYSPWPENVTIPKQLQQFIKPLATTIIWTQPPGYISDEALRIYFSVFAKLTHAQRFYAQGFYESEMNFGPYQIFGISPEYFRKRLRKGIPGIYYDTESDEIWIVDFYFGAVYNYLYRVFYINFEMDKEMFV